MGFKDDKNGVYEMKNTAEILELFGKQEDKLNDIEHTMEDIANSLKHLSEIAAEIKLLRTDLVQAATRNMPIETVKDLSKLHMNVIKTLCWILGAMCAWFTGAKYLFTFLGQ